MKISNAIVGGDNIANVVLIACKNVKPNCFGCAPCISGLLAKGDNVVASVECGGPPGNGIVAILNSINLWFKKNNPKFLPLTPVYGGCIKKCGQCKPKMDEMITFATRGRGIVEYEHPFTPIGLFEESPSME
jgi:hypothetical protein